ncbi:MAG: diguanylate cyclase [Saccharofermentanales bacterium]
MTLFETEKEKKMQEIIFIIKLFSLFFSAIAYFRYFANKIATDTTNHIYNVINLTLVFFILFIICVTWIVFDKKDKNGRIAFYRVIQPVIFLMLFIGAIIATGLYKSNFKYLFIFLVLSYTIEWGLRGGIIIASVSSCVLLVIDLIFVPSSGVNYYFEDDISLIGLFFVLAVMIGHYVKIERDHIDKLSSIVNLDGLTGLYNHRYFQECLKQSLKDSVITNKPVSLFIMDMDYFKQYNDVHGHQMGDELLKNVAKFLTENLDSKYKIFRYGGDEFAVILPDTSNQDAYTIAEKIWSDFSNKIFDGQEYMPNENITISIGIATYKKENSSGINLLKAADEALYKAKYFRRNRVEAYTSILDDLQVQEENNEDSLKTIASIKTLISVINSRDKFTFSHLQRVVSYCEVVSKDFQLTEKQKKILLYGAYMHDIGKIDIPKDVMMKIGALTADEWKELKLHPAIGTGIIQKIGSLKEVMPLILQHHERFDGYGYPNQLSGDQTDYLSRILAVVDAFDAMTSSRPYQVRKSFQEGFAELRRCSGTQFDPQIVETFITSIEKLNLSELNLLT